MTVAGVPKEQSDLHVLVAPTPPPPFTWSPFRLRSLHVNSGFPLKWDAERSCLGLLTVPGSSTPMHVRALQKCVACRAVAELGEEVGQEAEGN